MKTVLVTGATSGIGYETARGILRKGDHLIVINRSRSKWEQCCFHFQKEFPRAQISSYFADLSSMTQIREVCAEISKAHHVIDVLINNAGLYLAQRQTTEDGWETTFAVNHMAYVAICACLIDRVKASTEGRIIQVASRAHLYAHLDVDTVHDPPRYQGQRVYGTSKLCNIVHTRELAKRHTGITVNCVHPGVVQTGFAHNQGGVMGWGFRLLRRFFISAKKGAQTTLFLAYDESVREKTGGYYASCRLKVPSAQAQNDQLARQVWDHSMHLLEQAWNRS